MQQKQTSYLKVFITAFITFFILILPCVVINKGYMIYYGDFNSQQLPFLQHMHEAVKSGNILWDWNTDLGSDFISSYSYYLLGSPFFWLMLMFPTSMVLYTVPWILSLKYAVAALTAYAYIRRFVKKDGSAVAGGFLYAFSGFQAYNIFFNQFHDATAFFPLLLIAMEEHMTKDRRGVFAVTAAVLAMTNYFFFAGEAVFLIIYFLIRSRCRDFRVTPSRFFTLVLEAVLGTAVSAAILLPTALSVMSNYRLSEHLYGMDLLAYSDRTRIWRIIQGFFMIPDSPARPNLFSDGTSKWSSIAGYLPAFSMAAVIAYMKKRPDTWTSKLIRICIIFAFIPVLNSLFYMLNSQYYARWFYMPVLIMALMTAETLEHREIKTAAGFRICAFFYAAVLVISFLPSMKDDEVKWFSFGEYKEYFYISLGISAVLLAAAAYVFSCRDKGRKYIRKSVALAVSASFITTASVFYFGIYEGPVPERYIATSINDTSFEALSEDDTFFRTDISENCDNYAMFWGLPSMRCFHSTVSPSIMNFYESVGITRDVASRADTDYYALRSLFSVKYYFSRCDTDGNEETPPEMPGFIKISDGDHFAVYENIYCVPMGFTYDKYITDEKFSKLSDKTKANALIHAVLLDDDQAARYSDILECSDGIRESQLDNNTYYTDCVNHIASSCYEFRKSTGGFSAKIKTDRSSLVFFSVPYDKGFTAYVNGEKTDIEKVNNGFMAVKVPAGDSSITFSYMTYGLRSGIQISAAAFLMVLVYIIISIAHKKVSVKSGKALEQASSEITADEHIASLVIVKENPIDIDITPENEEELI